MYYQCSENKGADQHYGYREADLSLCFRICKKAVFSRRGSYMFGTVLNVPIIWDKTTQCSYIKFRIRLWSMILNMFGIRDMLNAPTYICLGLETCSMPLHMFGIRDFGSMPLHMFGIRDLLNAPTYVWD